ncbi:MAG: OmpH family outer membrane protein [Desulfovibrio sp.]|uniref:OmpH family outer membrane protein n=1 Tax=Desulfovibrio sp. 7SRBS1 TaxID=3378064 RepID=UPI003B3C8931
MKKCTLFVALLVFAFASMAHAKDVKIAVLNMQKIIETSEPGKQAMQELKAKFSQVQKDLEAQKNKIEGMRDELQKQSLVLSQEAKQSKEFEMRRMVRDFQDSYQNYQRKMGLEQKKISEPILKALVDVVKAYATKNGYTLVIDKNNSGLLYTADSVEKTNEVIVELNNAWKKKQAKK